MYFSWFRYSLWSSNKPVIRPAAPAHGGSGGAFLRAELGYFTSKIDGIYGEKTKAAVTRFQRDNGLTADGIAGTKTLSALGITSSGGTGGFSSSDINLLARIISAESRGEPAPRERPKA